MSGEQFSLVWNSYPTNLSSGLYTLLTDEHLVDVTLTAEGQILRAHKLILSVCSSYFRELFKGNTCKHPIVILKDVNYRDLSAMLHFMYQGEVNIKQEDISSFLKLAETLQIKGLTKERTESLDEQRGEEDPESVLKTEMPEANIDSRMVDHSDESHDVPSHAIRGGKSFVKLTSNAFFHQSEPDSDSENVMRSISNLMSDDYANREDIQPVTEDEPLDCTSTELRETSIGLEKPLNYRYNDPSHEFTVPNSEQMSCSRDSSQRESLGVNFGQQLGNTKDCEASSCAKGKRTVKGLPGGSLPLETTLRVVSELGPTIRVERGKIVRMYSCPWCLRHFTRKENLKLHVRYIHGPLESLTCKLCGNKYKNSNSLRVHSYLYHNAKRNKHAKPPLVAGNV